MFLDIKEIKWYSLCFKFTDNQITAKYMLHKYKTNLRSSSVMFPPGQVVLWYNLLYSSLSTTVMSLFTPSLLYSESSLIWSHHLVLVLLYLCPLFPYSLSFISGALKESYFQPLCHFPDFLLCLSIAVYVIIIHVRRRQIHWNLQWETRNYLYMNPWYSALTSIYTDLCIIHSSLPEIRFSKAQASNFLNVYEKIQFKMSRF